MAEARQAVAFQFIVTEEGGLKVDYSLEGIKVLLLSGWKSTYQKYSHFRNTLLVGVFPASPISLLLIASLLATAGYSGHCDVIGFCDRYISLLPGYVIHLCLCVSVLLFYTMSIYTTYTLVGASLGPLDEGYISIFKCHLRSHSNSYVTLSN